MRQTETLIRQIPGKRQLQSKTTTLYVDEFVLEKGVFNRIFEKDIRRVFIYKKAERLAKAILLISPAFVESVSLKRKVDSIAVNLIDAAILPPSNARRELSRELLSLSSVLSMARSNEILSLMNADIIAKEAKLLLEELSEYEEPRITLDETPTLSHIAKNAPANYPVKSAESNKIPPARVFRNSSKEGNHKGHIKDRREAIMSVIKNKDKASIKDISTLMRGISEKTIQRELTTLIKEGIITKRGERRWSTYSLALHQE